MPVFSEMTPHEKLELIEVLWDEIASNPDDVPIHDWQKDELMRRRELLQKDPASALTWEDVEKRLRDRHGR